MSKKKKINKSANSARAKRSGLRLAGISAAVALIVAAWVYTNNPSHSSNPQPKDGIAYVRRETKVTL